MNDNKGFAKINDDKDDNVSKTDVNTPISYCLSRMNAEMYGEKYINPASDPPINIPRCLAILVNSGNCVSYNVTNT